MQEQPSLNNITFNKNKDELINIYVKNQQIHNKYNDLTKNPETIRIATYNVQYWTNPKGEKNYCGILKIISEINADVLALEEVAMGIIPKNQLYIDLNKLGYHQIIFCNAQNYYGGEFGNLIASKYPIRQHLCQPLIKYKVGRCVIIADIQISTKILRIYCTHLDVFDNSEQTRKLQIESILNSANQSPFPTIILGDFNSIRRADYTAEEWNIIETNDRLRGITTRTLVTDILEFQGWKTSFDKIGAVNPKYTTWSGRTVDFIYCNSMININRTCVHHTSDSDHIPVIADLSSLK